MIFALGFLAASLCALLFLPTLNARASRLARRRVEATLPLSPREIAAERDHLRAGFAVEQRRLERRVEAAVAGRHADLAAIGARTMEAAALARDVKARDGLIAADRATIARVEGELGTARTDGATALAALGALEDAHADLLDALSGARGERDAARLTAVSADPEASPETAALRAERDALDARLAAAEAALSQARDAAAAELRGENDELRRRIGEVADALTGRERLPPAAAFPMKALT